MKQWQKKLISLICCMALVMTSVYVADYKRANAAEMTTTGKICIDDTIVGFGRKTENGGTKGNVENGNVTGHLNLACTITTNDGYAYTSNGQNFMNREFIDNYVTFGGGMTGTDLLDGMFSFYVANGQTLQFNWEDRTTVFTPGWSFTIAQGAPLSYKSGETICYLALDKEYTFSFADGNKENENVINITSITTTTFSMNTNSTYVLGNGLSGSSNLGFSVANHSLPDSYTWYYITEDTLCDGYIDFNGTDSNSALSATGLQIQCILGADGTCVLQVSDWGTWRDKLTKDSYWALKKGMPIKWTSGGKSYKAVLDATYIYYVNGSNSDNTQTYFSFKYDETLNNYGLASFTSKQTGPQANGYHINIPFDSASSGTITTGAYTDYATNKIARKYFDFAGWTDEELVTYGVNMDFIPGANVLQVVINGSGVNRLNVGDKITLKDGLPIVYFVDGVGMQSATLKGNYTITVIAKTNTTDTSVYEGGDGSVTYSMTETGSYSLSGSVSGYNEEGSAYYQNIYFDTSTFADITSRLEGEFDSQMIIDNYFYAKRGGKTVDLASEGWYFRYYYFLDGSVHQMFRYYCPEAYASSFADGDCIVWRKGLPLSYQTARGVKTVTLDRDYGYVWSTATNRFVYNAAVTYDNVKADETYESSLKFESAIGDTFCDENGVYRTNISISMTPSKTISEYVYPDILSDETSRAYIQIMGQDIEALRENGVEMLFLPTANILQIVWGSMGIDWMEKGMEIVFETGMPISFKADGIDAVTTLAKKTVYKVTDFDTENDPVELTKYKDGTTFALAPENGVFGTGTTTDAEAQVLIDVVTEEHEAGALDDAKISTYVVLSEDIVENYVDFCGLSVNELKAYGVYFKLVRTETHQGLQIFWGTGAQHMEIGTYLILREGLPFTYETVDGESKTVTLDKTYIYKCSGSNNENTRVFSETNAEIGGTWSLEFGTAYPVIKGNEEGYFSNISLERNDLINDVESQGEFNFEIDAGAVDTYLDFGNVSSGLCDKHGVMLIVVVNDTNKVVQVRWGDMSDHVEDGDQLVFKAGMPVMFNNKLYTLDRTYSFTLQESATGDSANGFRITGVSEYKTYQHGDANEDYYFNCNDLDLVRKNLASVVCVAATDIVDVNADGLSDSLDLVVAKKKNWETVAEPDTYSLLYKDNTVPKTIAVDGTITYAMNYDIDANNYFRFTYWTTQNLHGTLYYTSDGSNTEVAEEFFLSKDEVQFTQFFDDYRGNAAPSGRTLTRIKLENVGEEEAQIRLHKIEVTKRDFENSDMLYMNDTQLKIGVDLNMGGALGYMACVDSALAPVETYEQLSSGFLGLGAYGDVRIETGTSHSGETYNNEVNLINIYDLGRQVQQAYYIAPDSSEYTWGYYNEQDWCYNPVQAGDTNGNKSQIIDYRCIDTDTDGIVDLIYVKVRAMDWAKDGVTTKSYMENWYKLEDGLLYVDNEFVNWEGFTYKNLVESKTQELPALYVAQSLNYFATGNNPTTLNTYGDWNIKASDYAPYLADYSGTKDEPSDWYAWVNNNNAANAFGVGIYIPYTDACTAGRPTQQRTTRYSQNKQAGDSDILDLGLTYLNTKYNAVDSDYREYMNCFTSNTSYIAPTVSAYLKDYTSYSYTYVLAADSLTGIQESFETVKTDGEVDKKNEGFMAW